MSLKAGLLSSPCLTYNPNTFCQPRYLKGMMKFVLMTRFWGIIVLLTGKNLDCLGQDVNLERPRFDSQLEYIFNGKRYHPVSQSYNKCLDHSCAALQISQLASNCMGASS